MRILLVEDEPATAAMLAKGLREQSYAVDIAETGNNALHKAHVNRYDVIILDVVLPDLNGFQVCESLRSAGLTTPVLMLTALDSVPDRVHGLDCGADDYLSKPFHLLELFARVRALLRRGPKLLDPVLRVEDLEVDTRAHRVHRRGRLVDLTAKEYALLECLAREPGKVMGREEISEHVWDEGYDPFSNLIEVYIQRLRRKLDEGSDKALLHTRRGEGYWLGTGDDE